MKLALTGATGFIGSHVLTDLQEHSHEVTRSSAPNRRRKRSKLAAQPRRLSISTIRAPSRRASRVDGAIHTASPGDATSADLDAAVVDAAIDAFAGTGKPYAHISGLWIYGSNLSITEDSPFDAPPLVAWKLPIQARLLYGSDIRSAVIVAGTAYGDGGGGIPALLLGSPRDEAGT